MKCYKKDSTYNLSVAALLFLLSPAAKESLPKTDLRRRQPQGHEFELLCRLSCSGVIQTSFHAPCVDISASSVCVGSGHTKDARNRMQRVVEVERFARVAV